MPVGLPVGRHGHRRSAVPRDADRSDARYPKQAAVFLTFNRPVSQRIYGGSDIFLMPSRSEPCGLNQMVAMRYGCVPVVHAIGGLADTVTDFRPETGDGNGFTFRRSTRWRSTRPWCAPWKPIATARSGTNWCVGAWRSISRGARPPNATWICIGARSPFDVMPRVPCKTTHSRAETGHAHRSSLLR